MENNDCCLKCRFYDENSPEEEAGLCVAHPPKKIALDGELITIFPDVEAFEWCGEFRPKK